MPTFAASITVRIIHCPDNPMLRLVKRQGASISSHRRDREYDVMTKGHKVLEGNEAARSRPTRWFADSIRLTSW